MIARNKTEVYATLFIHTSRRIADFCRGADLTNQLLLFKRVLNRVLGLFLIDLAIRRGLGVVGCRSEGVRGLAGSETLRGLLGFRKQFFIYLDIESDDGVPPRIGLLRAFEQLKVDLPANDVAGGGVLFKSENHFSQSVWCVQLEVDLELDDGRFGF